MYVCMYVCISVHVYTPVLVEADANAVQSVRRVSQPRGAIIMTCKACTLVKIASNSINAQTTVEVEPVVTTCVPSACSAAFSSCTREENSAKETYNSNKTHTYKKIHSLVLVIIL